MDNSILFFLPGNEILANQLAHKLNCEMGSTTIRQFPDEESYVRIISEIEGKKVFIVCSLDRPDTKLLPLMFLAKTARQLGATKITLILPYLPYMRQDRRFHPGEAVTSEIFSSLISECADELITVDPHLHRRSNLSEIYSIPAIVAHAASPISQWVKDHIPNPLLVGPDQESEQWVAEVAREAASPFVISEKIKNENETYSVRLPDLKDYQNKTPVLVDDIISTGKTMTVTIKKLIELGMNRPICIGVHGIFVKQAYIDLLKAGAETIITSNTIPHPANGIDICDLLLEKIYPPLIS